MRVLVGFALFLALLIYPVLNFAQESELSVDSALTQYEKCIGFDVFDLPDYFILVKFVHRESGVIGFNAAERILVCLSEKRSSVLIKASSHILNLKMKNKLIPQNATMYLGKKENMLSFHVVYGGGLIVWDLRTLCMVPLGLAADMNTLCRVEDDIFPNLPLSTFHNPVDYDFYFLVTHLYFMDLDRIEFIDLRRWLIDSAVRDGLEK